MEVKMGKAAAITAADFAQSMRDGASNVFRQIPDEPIVEQFLAGCYCSGKV